MRQRDENFVSMCRTTRRVLEEHTTTWSTVVAVANIVNNFYSVMDDLEESVVRSEIVSTGASKDKDALKKRAVALGVNLAKRASVYALDSGNFELHDQLRVTKSTLERRPDTLTLTKLRDIHARIDAIRTLVEDYGIRVSDLDELKTAIDSYDAVIERPRHLIIERATENQDSIPSLLTELREILYRLDSMMNLFQGSELAKEYKGARIIIDLGTRKSDSEDITPVTE